MTTIIGFTGKRGSGKDCAAQALVNHRDFHALGFADPLRQICSIAYGLSAQEMSDRVLKEKNLDRWPHKSPREILQYVGTEMFRHWVDDTWTQALIRRAQPFPRVVVTDVRYLNEAACIRQAGGKIIRIIRPGHEKNDVAAQHTSETELDLICEDARILNDGTIEDLHCKVLVQADSGAVGKFKKIAPIEAIQLNWKNWHVLCGFMGDAVSLSNSVRQTQEYSDTCGEFQPYIELSIPTLEGDHLAKHGDWIAKGINGEFWPIKPDIFAQTYERIGA